MSACDDLMLGEAGTCDSESEVHDEPLNIDEDVHSATENTIEKKKRKSKYDHLLSAHRDSKDRRRALSALYEGPRKERRNRIGSRFADDPEVKACTSQKERRALLQKLYKKHGPAKKVDKPVVHPIEDQAEGKMQAHQHMVVQSIKEEVKEKPLLRTGSVMSSCKGGRGNKRLEGR